MYPQFKIQSDCYSIANTSTVSSINRLIVFLKKETLYSIMYVNYLTGADVVSWSSVMLKSSPQLLMLPFSDTEYQLAFVASATSESIVALSSCQCIEHTRAHKRKMSCWSECQHPAAADAEQFSTQSVKTKTYQPVHSSQQSAYFFDEAFASHAVQLISYVHWRQNDCRSHWTMVFKNHCS